MFSREFWQSLNNESRKQDEAAFESTEETWELRSFCRWIRDFEVKILIWKFACSGEDEDDTGNRVVTSRHTTIEVKVPRDVIGAVIGPQGAQIKTASFLFMWLKIIIYSTSIHWYHIRPTWK